MARKSEEIGRKEAKEKERTNELKGIEEVKRKGMGKVRKEKKGWKVLRMCQGR